jgi:hypothetical protein
VNQAVDEDSVNRHSGPENHCSNGLRQSFPATFRLPDGHQLPYSAFSSPDFPYVRVLASAVSGSLPLRPDAASRSSTSDGGEDEHAAWQLLRAVEDNGQI